MAPKSFCHHIYLYLVVVLSSFILFACSPGNAYPPTTTPEPGVYRVDPVFREFYRALGGGPVLGPAISNLFQKEQMHCQYTANVLMCYNPDPAEENKAFSLYPVGRSLDVRDNPQVSTEKDGQRVVDGYVIYDEFLPLYDRLRGAFYAGHPLTQLRANYSQNRIEQYFENVGFYRLDSEPEGRVHLIAYGAYDCKMNCQFTPPVESGVIGGSAEVQQYFLPSILRIGGVSIFGQPLTAPYKTTDGGVEQVYEKAVFFSSNDDPRGMNLRKAPLILGISFSLPGPKINDNRIVFYPTVGETGYNVPRIFDSFIAAHGGMDVSGRPISDIARVPDETIYRQCFENYCLDYDPSAPESLRIQLTPIGQRYLEHNQYNGEIVSRFVFSAKTVLLRVGEKKPQVSNTENQEIYMVVLQSKNQRPINNIEGTLTLNLPNGETLKFNMPPTNANGSSRVTIPPQPSIQNGTVVPYSICLNGPENESICAQESYLVWNAR